MTYVLFTFDKFNFLTFILLQKIIEYKINILRIKMVIR